MTLAMAVAGARFVGLVAYTILGGADFGSGFYDLTAGSATRVAKPGLCSSETGAGSVRA